MPTTLSTLTEEKLTSHKTMKDEWVQFDSIHVTVVYMFVSLSSYTREAGEAEAAAGLSGVSWTGLDSNCPFWIHWGPKETKSGHKNS